LAAIKDRLSWDREGVVCGESATGTESLVSGTPFESPIDTLTVLREIEGYICLKDIASKKAPEHVPPNVESAFREDAACLSISCPNAAGTLFHLCNDLATRPMLPGEEVEGLNAKTRRDLGLRLPLLFDNSRLPEASRELSSCIKNGGNDGAHQGTLTEDDARHILDFPYVLSRLVCES
jgi:hypothetical protein